MGLTIPVAVNISARQLKSDGVVEVIKDAIAQAGIEPQLLEIELTENTLIQDIRASAGILARLRDAGITIALDDFGTGYSSLSNLQNLPLDALKIHPSLLTDSENRSYGAGMLRGVVELAHTLGLRVIGEGVETQVQLDLLAELGCDELQGFFLGKPSFHATNHDVIRSRPRNLAISRTSVLADQLSQVVH